MFEKCIFSFKIFMKNWKYWLCYLQLMAGGNRIYSRGITRYVYVCGGGCVMCMGGWVRCRRLHKNWGDVMELPSQKLISFDPFVNCFVVILEKQNFDFVILLLLFLLVFSRFVSDLLFGERRQVISLRTPAIVNHWLISIC